MKKQACSVLILFAFVSVVQAQLTPILVSTDATGVQGNDWSQEPSISADGRLVAFISRADNLVPDDTNGESDVFVKNLETGSIVRVNRNATSVPGQGFRNDAEISQDGRFVAFVSGVDGRDISSEGVSADVFVTNLETGGVVQVNLDADGTPIDGVPTGIDAYNPSISADGRFVAFESSEITSGYGGDVFVKDLTTGGLLRVNEDAAGNRLNEDSAVPKISADGSIVLFENFVISQAPAPTLTRWVKNLLTGELIAVNQDIVGQQETGPGGYHSISANGVLVAFSTTARLVPADTNSVRDVFVKNVETGDIKLVSQYTEGVTANRGSFDPNISADGRRVTFRSASSNLVAEDTFGFADPFVKNLSTGDVVRISRNVDAGNMIPDASGQRLVFSSSSNDLIPEDTNEQSDIFLVDTADIAPTKPGNLRVEIRSATEGDIFWDRSSDIDGIIGYEVTRNGEFIELLDTLSLSQADLLPGVLYTYSVTAVDNDGNRSDTASISFATDAVAPSMPQNLRFQLYSDTTAEIFWDRSSDDMLVQGYEIFRNNELLGVRDVLSVFDGNLVPGNVYTYSVTAIDNEGIRSNPATVSFSTNGLAPGRPENLRFQVYSNTAAEIFWNRSASANGLESYEIVRNGELLDTRNGLSLFDDTLIPGVTYTYAVTAVDNQGNRSSAALVTLLAFVDVQPVPTGPSRPGALRFEVYSNTAAEIFWDRSTDNGFIQGYEINRNGETSGILDIQSVFYDDLVPGVTYDFTVTAIDNEGNRSVSATTSLVTALAKPGSLRANVYSTTAAELFWDRSTPGGLLYEINRNGVIIDQIDGVSYFDDDLTASTLYQYQITALDSNGQRSEPSLFTLITFPNE